jgi:MFS superfamily sulfate permease-like transporter
MKKNNFTSELALNARSGLMVFLVALPLCLGISLASGAPLMAGLIAGIVGGIVIGGLSNSHISVSGPAAGLAIIVYQGIIEVGGFQNFCYAVVLAGFLQIALGFLKAGKITDYLPLSVIEGMMAAIGILLIIKQLPYIFGEKSYSDLYEIITFHHANKFHLGAMMLGILSVLLFSIYRTGGFASKKIFKIVPFPLLLVLGTSSMAIILKTTSVPLYYEDYVHIQDFIKNFNLWQNFSLSGLGHIIDMPVIKTAFVIAIVASIETLLCIEASDKLDTKKRITDKNRELKAQGIGNMLSGLLGGLPITSVVVRSSANAQSGATHKISTILHGFFILFSIVFLAHLIDLIPLATLAAILIFTGYNLANLKLIKKMYYLGHAQFIPFMTTIVCVIGLDLLKGVLIGVLASIIITLKDHYMVQNQQLKVIKDLDDSIKLEFGSHLTFIEKKFIKNAFDAVPANTLCILNFEKTLHMDHEIEELIETFIREAKNLNIRTEIINSQHLKHHHDRKH